MGKRSGKNGTGYGSLNLNRFSLACGISKSPKEEISDSDFKEQKKKIMEKVCRTG